MFGSRKVLRKKNTKKNDLFIFNCSIEYAKENKI